MKNIVETTDTAFRIESTSTELDRAVDLLDAAAYILRPLSEPELLPAEAEDCWRMSDAVLLAARRAIVEAADCTRGAARELLTGAAS